MALVGHRAHGVHGPAAGLELEVAVRFAALAAQVVDRVFVDRAVAPSCVDEVAVWAPARTCAPRRRAALWDNCGDG